eukprot:gnl/TRDRNA2_/TRDRNA2_175849_c2_seq2.p1 gnl/TRDRNA2_/TRDRNA2_175849_c2~~gnl/TRDRNA2_/TRDRNA2_175849_c2_seq2.p1  ORF type:complete len:626 (+),score=105.64 gnl/TRDRNA2_/TRDRNA2_175849_c2_seq2:163-1878(+)
MAVGCGATADGSCMASTSADGSPLDFRLVYVPAKDHPKGSMRPIYAQKQDYPRYVDANRAPGYAPKLNQKNSVPIGYIPEVEHTYAYWDGVYGIMNEHQLSFGESSCSAKLTAAPLGSPNGTALFEVGELNDIALERCKTARCAIQTMGDLAEQHGFYVTGSPEEVMEAGEALTIADTSEAWVFHILPDDTGRSAVWAAKRVPTGEATVVPNVFVIRDIDPEDTENYMYSKNMFSLAKKLGWWDGKSVFDFTAVYSPGEYMHPYYAGRRIWRALSLFAPSLNLDPKLGVNATKKTYPFSVKPDKPVTLDDMYTIYRDHLEGTEFDLTKGVGSGPFHTPNRYDSGPVEGSDAFKYGAWERAIGLYRTSISFVAQARPGKKAGGILHFGPSQQHATVYTPIFTSILEDSPLALAEGNQNETTQASLWWAVTSLANLMDSRYESMIKDTRAMQRSLEGEVFHTMIKQVDAAEDPLGADRKKLTEMNNKVVDDTLRKVWDTFWAVMAKYQNGYDDFGYTKVGYSAEWLEAAGYTKFSAKKEQFDQLIADFKKANTDARAILKTHVVPKQEATLVV